METTKRNILALMGSLFMMQMLLTPQLGYLSLFYQDRGMTPGEIGLLFGLAPFVSVFGQYIWGVVADKAKSVNSVMMMVAACTLCVVPFFLWAEGFLPLMLCACVYNLFSTSLSPLGDAVNIYYSSANGFPFGRIRLMGSLGYMVCMLVAGFAADVNIDSIFYLQLVFGVIYILTLPATPRVAMPKMKKMAFNPLLLLKKPSVLMVLLISAPIFISFGFNVTFYGPYIVNQLGVSSAFIGYTSVVSIAVEVTFFLFFDKIMHRFPIRWLLLSIAALVVLRWGVYGITSNMGWILVFAGIDGISSVATYGFMSFYFKRIAPPEGKVSTQTFASIFYCLCKAVGSLTGAGIIGMTGSQQGAYGFFALLIAAVSLVFALIPVKFQKEVKE